MAQTVHLYLKANRQNIVGESTQHSLDRAQSIECLSFVHAVEVACESATGLPSGRRQYQPLRITKRIDCSSPLLYKALVESQRIDAEFRFFRTSPAGDGQTQQFYTVAIEDGRISSLQQRSDDTLTSSNNGKPPLEEVTFVFSTISWTYMPTGVTHEDSWSNNR